MVSPKNTDTIYKDRYQHYYKGKLIKDPYWRIQNAPDCGFTGKLDIYLPRPRTVEQQKTLIALQNKKVKYVIIDEFTHPELFKDVGFMDGKKYAKLIDYEK